MTGECEVDFNSECYCVPSMKTTGKCSASFNDDSYYNLVKTVCVYKDYDDAIDLFFVHYF